MLSTEEIVDLGEYLRRDGLKSSPYQIFAAQQVLLSVSKEEPHLGSLVQLTTHFRPIFCTSPEEQEKFERVYLRWLRLRSGRPNTMPFSRQQEGKQPDIPTSHWRLTLVWAGLLILPLLTSWFLWQDLRTRQVVGRIVADQQPIVSATVRLGTQTTITDINGTFQLSFQAKDTPLELTVEMVEHLPSQTLIGQSINTQRNSFYLHPVDWSDQLKIGVLSLKKEVTEAQPQEALLPTSASPSLPTMSLAKEAVLKIPPPSWVNRLDFLKTIAALIPILIVISWLLYRITLRPVLQRQSKMIPPELKHVRVRVNTQQIFPSISLRYITQRFRQPRFVESPHLDLQRTIQLTTNRGGLFTPIYGSKYEPGYVALIDRTTMADHQATLVARFVQDLAKGYVLIRQYEFDEQPTILQAVDPLRPTPKPGPDGIRLLDAVEVVSLKDVLAKFPVRRLLCFVDPVTCFDPLTGKPRSWIETLEEWEERFLFTTNDYDEWGQAERILSRRGFHVIPMSALGLRLFSSMLEGSHNSGENFLGSFSSRLTMYDRMRDRWLERHPPSLEVTGRLLNELRQDLGSDGMLWLAGCAAYPEIHWALTLEWGERLFAFNHISEMLLPKLSRLIWFRHSFMPDWFRQALYDQLTGAERVQISQNLSEILSALNPEGHEGLQLHIATQPGKKPGKKPLANPMRAWFQKLGGKLSLPSKRLISKSDRALRDFVMLRYLSGKRGKALSPYVPKALMSLLFPKGQSWLGLRPALFLIPAAIVAIVLFWSLDPIPVSLPSPIQAVSLSRDGNTMATGLKDGRLIVWDLRTRLLAQHDSGGSSGVRSVSVSNDGNLLASGFQDGIVRVSGKKVRKERLILSDDISPVTNVTFWPTQKKPPRLVSVSETGFVGLKAFEPSKFEKFLGRNVSAIAFSQNGAWAVAGTSEGTVWVSSLVDSDLESFFSVKGDFILLKEHAGELKSLVWDPTGTFVMGIDSEGILRIWEKRSGAEIAKVKGPLEEVSGLSWPLLEKAFLTLSRPAALEVWRINNPVQLFQKELTRQKQEKIALRRAEERARAEKKTARLSRARQRLLKRQEQEKISLRKAEERARAEKKTARLSRSRQRLLKPLDLGEGGFLNSTTVPDCYPPLLTQHFSPLERDVREKICRQTSRGFPLGPVHRFAPLLGPIEESDSSSIEKSLLGTREYELLKPRGKD